MFVLFLVSSLCHAQKGVFKGNFNVYLKSGRVISTDYLRIIHTGSSARASIVVRPDDVRIAIDSVDRVEGIDAAGNNRYIRPGMYGASNIWIERMFRSDHIELYVTRVTPQSLLEVRWSDYHYTKDNGPLTTLNIKDVERDVHDDPAALVFVKKAKVTRGFQAGFLVGGAATYIGGLASKPKSRFDFWGKTAAVDGVVLGSIALILRPAKLKNLVKALKAYAPAKKGRDSQLIDYGCPGASGTDSTPGVFDDPRVVGCSPIGDQPITRSFSFFSGFEICAVSVGIIFSPFEMEYCLVNSAP